MKLLLLCLIFLPQAGALPKKTIPFAKVLSLEGLVSLEPEHTNLTASMELSEGDRVTVMHQSKLRLKLENGTVIEIGQDSDLLLKRDREKKILLRLAHGTMLAANQAGKPLEVRSGQLELKFVSEGFYVDQKLDKPAFVAVYSGKADARWRSGSTKLESKNREQASFIYPDKENPIAAGKNRNDPSPAEWDKLKKLL